ncbi:TPA: LPXTG cell wall anchor domain-containing protein, partial [Streptococcus pneumoniae]
VKPAEDAKLGDKVKTVADSKLGVNAKKSDDVKETKKVSEDKKELPATGSSNLISTILSALGVSLLGMLGIKLTRKN